MTDVAHHQPVTWWTRGQLLFVGGQALAALAAAAGLWLVRPDQATSLWMHPQGRKMLTVGGVLLAGDVGSFLLVGFLLNRFLPHAAPDNRVWRRSIHCIAGLILVLFLFLPVLYLLFTWPGG